MSLKSPQYRASLLPQLGSLHGVHAIMLADTGLPPESSTFMQDFVLQCRPISSV